MQVLRRCLDARERSPHHESSTTSSDAAPRRLVLASAFRPHLLALALVVALAGPSPAAPLSVSATLGVTSASLGELLEYTITVSAPPGSTTTLSALASALASAGIETVSTTAAAQAALQATTAATSAPGAALLDPRPDSQRTSRVGDVDVTVRKWRVAPFALGPTEIAGARLRYTLPGGQPGELPIPAVPLQVGPVALPANMKPADGQTFGVKPPVFIPVAATTRWGLAALIIALGFLVALALWNPELFARLFGRRAGPPPPPRPAHVIALEALDVLVAEGLIQRGQVREYYGRLSEILRGYIDSRFGLRSLEATTDELTPILRRHEVLGKQWLEPLRKFLTTCDLAKFARHVPPQSVTDEATAFARQVVRETRPEEHPKEPETAAPREATAP